MKQLILASTSSYKSGLLARLGLPFQTRDPAVDEIALPGERPTNLALRLAKAKATAAALTMAAMQPADPNATKAPVEPGSIRSMETVIIGADQAPALGNELLRKPGNHETALRQLMACQGQTVSFHTAAAVIDTASGQEWASIITTEVDFARLSQKQLDHYLRREQPYDCAGGFKAEALGIVLFEAIRSNDPTALIGLPLIWLARVLRQAGLDPLESAS